MIKRIIKRFLAPIVQETTKEIETETIEKVCQSLAEVLRRAQDSL